MSSLFTKTTLRRQRAAFAGTAGDSRENSSLGFQPAFRDRETGRVELSRFDSGDPAPVHLFDGLPESWVAQRDAALRVLAVKASIVAGFVRDGRFYTRFEAAEAAMAESAGQPSLQPSPVYG